MTDIAFANVAAATAAGYRLTETDFGSGNDGGGTGRYKAVLDKPVYGGTHQSGHRIVAEGWSASAATSARVAAVAALNNQRGHRYGFGTTVQINDDTLGTVEVLDAS